MGRDDADTDGRDNAEKEVADGVADDDDQQPRPTSLVDELVMRLESDEWT